MHRLLGVLAFSLFMPAAFPAESGGASNYPAAAPAEVVRMLFRAPGAFRVAQAATVPISVTHGASFIPLTDSGFALAPNTFGSIFGTVEAGGGGGRILPNLPVNDWGDDFEDNGAGPGPKSLNGVRVLINGKEAFLAFVGRAEQLGTSFDQINFLAPDDDALGPVSFEVFIGQDRVGASMVNLGPVSPGLFAFAPAAGSAAQYVVAIGGADGKFLLPPGFFPALETRPAKSGEVIIMYGTGFGETEPPMPVGQIPTALSVILPAADVQVRIGGLPASVDFAGLAPCCAGLFQFNVHVPQLSNGNHAVTIERNGVSSQDGLSLLIQND